MLMKLTTMNDKPVYVSPAHIAVMWPMITDGIVVGSGIQLASDAAAEYYLTVKETPDDILGKPVWQKLMSVTRR